MDFGYGYGSCGATALEGGWVITAAHCVVNDYRDPVYGLSLTLYNSDGEKELVRPMGDVDFFVPAGYYPPGQTEKEYFYGDLALIKVPELKDRTDIIYPRLPNSRREAEGGGIDNQILVTLGVGLTETGSFPEDLEFMSVTRKGAVGETPGFSRSYEIERDHFVAKDNGGEDQDACRGDSGGGIFIPSRRWVDLTADSELDRSARSLDYGEDVLVGVVSHGPTECGVPGAYTAYTDVYYWSDWIREIMSEN